MFTLCEELGVRELNGACPAHGGDACLRVFVPVDDEWQQLREQRDNYRHAAEIAKKRLWEAMQECRRGLDAISKPRDRLMGVLPPLVPDDPGEK